RHTRWPRDWSSDVCSSDLEGTQALIAGKEEELVLLNGPAHHAAELLQLRWRLIACRQKTDRAASVACWDVVVIAGVPGLSPAEQIGRASCREGVDGAGGCG